MADLFVYPRKGDPFQVALPAAGSLRIGRAEDNDLVLPDQFASGHHAAVAASPRGFVLQDRGSKNGTFLNGSRLDAETELKRGDQILIGSTRIVYDRESGSQVEFVDTSPAAESWNTIMEVKDVLKKPAPAPPRARSSSGATPPGAAKPAAAPSTDSARLEREQMILAALSEVSQALIHHQPMDRLLEHIMDLLSSHIPIDRGILMLQEGNPPQLVPRVVRSTLAAKGRTAAIQVSRSVVNAVLGRNQSILISDIGADSRFREQASLVQANIHSAMCVPLWNNQDIIGLVYVDRAALFNAFTEDDLRLMTLLANVAAVKIENARLFEQAVEKSRMERELTLAAQIQRNFLPRGTPDFPPFELAGENRSCERIGGDYFDFLPFGGNRLGLVIADVSGKGVGAALLMASLRAALHAEADVSSSLARAAARLNEFVHASSEAGDFISFFMGVLETSGRMEFVNAGHNPPLLVSASGSVRKLESTGFCLGMFPAVGYETRKAEVAPGDVLCLFTDGIVEARNGEGEEYGDDRLAALLTSSAGRPAPEILERVFGEVGAFAPSVAPADDMTCVIVRRPL